MKRYLRASEGLSETTKKQLRHYVNSIIFYMWNDGDKLYIGGEGSTHQKTVDDYMNSDYSSLSKYIMDHKQDVFPRGDFMMKVDEYARNHKNSYAIRQEMLKIFDNYTEADFARNLYLRRDDPKKNSKKSVDSSKDTVECSYAMEDKMKEYLEYNTRENHKDEVDIYYPAMEKYFKDHPGVSVEMLFGILLANDERYQAVFKKMKELGYRPRESWYSDRVTTQAMTIDTDDKEIPEDLWQAVKPYPDVEIVHVSTHKSGKGQRKMKFSLRDMKYKEIKDEAYQEARRRKETVESSENISDSEHPLFKYFDLYDDDESFMRDAEFDDDMMDGFRIGDEPENYDGYKLVYHAIAKEPYADKLGDSGYDVLDVYEDPGDGSIFFGYISGGRLQDIDWELESILEDAEDDEEYGDE